MHFKEKSMTPSPCGDGWNFISGGRKLDFFPIRSRIAMYFMGKKAEISPYVGRVWGMDSQAYYAFWGKDLQGRIELHLGGRNL